MRRFWAWLVRWFCGPVASLPKAASEPSGIYRRLRTLQGRLRTPKTVKAEDDRSWQAQELDKLARWVQAQNLRDSSGTALVGPKIIRRLDAIAKRLRETP